MFRASLPLAVCWIGAGCGGSDAPIRYDGGWGFETTLSVSPTAHDFGDIPVGGTSPARAFTLVNLDFASSGTVSHAIHQSTEFQITGSTCNHPLAYMETCEVRVVFRPAEAGQRTGRLDFTTAANGGSFAVLLSGVGIGDAGLPDAGPADTFPADGSPAPDAQTDAPAARSSVRLEPSDAFLFEDTPIPTRYTPLSFWSKGFGVFNDGPVPLGPPSAAITGANPGDFAITVDRCAGGMLAPQGRCMITVRFQPSSAEPKEAVLQVDFGGGNRAAVALRGVGREPAWLALDPPRRSFGGVAVGQKSSFTFEVVNAGRLASGPPELVWRGMDGDQFTAQADPACMIPVPPQGRCTVKVTFQPTSAGLKTATVRVSSSPSGYTEAKVGGYAFVPQGQLDLSGKLEMFGQVAVGDGARSESVFVQNQGTTPAGPIAASATGPDAADFTVMNLCPSSLSPGATCRVAVIFAPAMAGARTATLQVTAPPGGVATWPLRGVAVPPTGIYALATELDLGLVPVGNKLGATQLVEVALSTGFAAGTGPLTVALEGPEASSYQVLDDDCSMVGLGGPLALCTFKLRLVPTSTGPKSAAVVVSASPGGTARVFLSGTGI
jgi:hypothetical protein